MGRAALEAVAAVCSLDGSCSFAHWRPHYLHWSVGGVSDEACPFVGGARAAPCIPSAASHPQQPGAFPLRPRIRASPPPRTYLFPIKMQLDGKWMTHSFWKVPSSGGAWALKHVLDTKIYKPLSPFYFGVEERTSRVILGLDPGSTIY